MRLAALYPMDIRRIVAAKPGSDLFPRRDWKFGYGFGGLPEELSKTYERVKAAAEEATDVLEDTYTTAAKGAADYNLKVIEAARTNTNAAFDYARELLDVKSISEVLELSTAHARKQFETVSEQTKELAALAQKVATETAEPLKSGVTKAFRKVA